MTAIKAKICGLSRAEDVQLAVHLGAWALGFIFFPSSPRSVSAAAVARITHDIPKSILRVGVFVNESFDTIAGTVKEAGLSHLQLHGTESPEFCRELKEKLGLPIFKAFHLRESADLAKIKNYDSVIDAVLVDAAVPGEWGGTGQLADWELAIAAKSLSDKPFILSGGLNPVNIAQAIARLRPYAVDLSSGLESAVRIKDPQKMQKFFKELKS